MWTQGQTGVSWPVLLTTALGIFVTGRLIPETEASPVVDLDEFRRQNSDLTEVINVIYLALPTVGTNWLFCILSTWVFLSVGRKWPTRGRLAGIHGGGGGGWWISWWNEFWKLLLWNDSLMAELSLKCVRRRFLFVREKKAEIGHKTQQRFRFTAEWELKVFEKPRHLGWWWWKHPLF